jgi:hypothetical protein
MDKSVLGLLGGVSALALLGGSAGALAAVPSAGAVNQLQPAQSYAELLDPIPNAANLLRAEVQNAGERARLETTQYFSPDYYYHHHPDVLTHSSFAKG